MPTETPRDGARRVAEVAEDLVQPLTAVLARVAVLQQEAQHGPIEDLTGQLAALRASAERLADRIDGIRDTRGR